MQKLHAPAFRTVSTAFLILTFLLFPGQGNAQSDTTGAYWRVLTSAATRKTEVRFFDARHALLYEEVLPDKWIKQNRRTRRKLDKLLAGLQTNQLLASQLQTEELPPAPAKTRELNSTWRRKADSTAAPYLVHASINSEGKLRVVIDNPDGLRYRIELLDHNSQPVYQEFSRLENYRRHLDISQLPHESLRVLIQIDKKTFLYNIHKEKARSNYRINAESAPNS